MTAEPLRHVVILAHPNPQSFNAAVAAAYRKAAEALGHSVMTRDLYAVGFDPRLSAGEIPGGELASAPPEIAAERALLADADVFAFIYPLWFNAPPAILVGYVQRVFGMGFGYGPQRGGENQRLLPGRRLISFSSSGAPEEWLRAEGAWEALRTLFDRHVAGVCGMTALEHRHFGAVTPSAPRTRLAAHLAGVREVVRANFA
ncbi:MAG: NAD(P)H-dependent oxidoreductase [Hyphomonadaceae bacterium]